MTTIIKNGTIVTHDLTYKADVAIENGMITEIGPDLKGDETLDATGCYVMPGGIDPHVHLEMPFMGTYSSDDFESGTRAALAGGTTMVVDFCLPNQGESLLDAIKRWDNKSTRANCAYSFHMAVTWWGEQVFNDMKTVIEDRGINTFKHFLAYKGALMVNDDELFSSFNRLAELGGIAMVHAENGDVVAELSAKLLAEGNSGPEAHAYSRPSQVEGEATNRAIMLADMRSQGLPDEQLKEMITKEGFEKYKNVVRPNVEAELRARLAATLFTAARYIEAQAVLNTIDNPTTSITIDNQQVTKATALDRIARKRSSPDPALPTSTQTQDPGESDLPGGHQDQGVPNHAVTVPPVAADRVGL